MWNNRYEPIRTGDSSVNRELTAIRERELEKEQGEELMLKEQVEELFDDKLYSSLKKILVKLTKAS